MDGVHPGLHSRGYLPHFDPGSAVQSIVIRLADSLPQAKLLEMQRALPVERVAERRMAIEAWLDRGAGACFLRRPECANIVQDQLLHFAGERYKLYAWCVMPNHAHILMHVFQGYPLSKSLQSIKSYSARRLNELLGTSGRIWEPEYFDRWIRSDEHFRNEVEYIEYNPVAAGLCRLAQDWPFSSAQWRAGAMPPRIG
jgi:REP element-mobilizing transposase RayT